MELIKNVEAEMQSGRLDYSNEEIEQKTKF